MARKVVEDSIKKSTADSIRKEAIAIQKEKAIAAALDGKLSNVEYDFDPIFGMAVPQECPGVPSDILNPRNTWTDKNAYDEKAKFLAGLFIKNFEKYKDGAAAEVLAAGPKI